MFIYKEDKCYVNRGNLVNMSMIVFRTCRLDDVEQMVITKILTTITSLAKVHVLADIVLYLYIVSGQ